MDPGLGLPDEMATVSSEVAVALPTLEILNLLPEIVIHDVRRHPIGPVIFRRRNACVVFLALVELPTFADDDLTFLDRLDLRHRAAEEWPAVIDRDRDAVPDDFLRPNPLLAGRREGLS